MTALGFSPLALVHAAVTLRAVDAAAEIEPTVQAAQSGDLTAFARIYREHVGRVYALCVRLSANRVFAEQLTQDTFVRAWERIGTYRGEVELPPDVGAELRADTVHGSVHVAPKMDAARVQDHHVEGRLGKGGGELRLRTVNGPIEVR